MECDKVKFTKNFMVYSLNGIEAILGNTFLDVYHVNVLKRSFKLRVITILTYKSIKLEMEYQVNLPKVTIHLVSL